MAAYDSPGFLDHLPGLPPQSSHDYGTAPGSDASYRPEPQITVMTGLPGVGSVMPLTGSGAVVQPSQADAYDREPVTGVQLGSVQPVTTGQDGAAGPHGTGHVKGSRHPNAPRGPWQGSPGADVGGGSGIGGPR